MRVLISRRRGGLGDQICCEVAVRAARQKHPDAEIWWAVDDPYFTLFFDQKHAANEVLFPDPWDEVLPSLIKLCDEHYDLDGPEMRHQLATNYNLTESRIESWCKYVDCIPMDMSPQWHSSTREREAVVSWLTKTKLEPFKFILVQWQSAEQRKDYPHTRELVELLKQQDLPVVVCWHGTVPDLGIFVAENWPLRELACLHEMAALVIGPDSSSQHLAAAVKTPSLGLFGPTNPKLYLKHYPLSNFIWDVDSMKGKPCEHTVPCCGLPSRNWWCRSNPSHRAHCLSSVSPEVVVEKVYDIISRMEAQQFYQQKALSFVSTSSLFYFIDPRVDLTNLHKVNSAHKLLTLDTRPALRQVQS